MKQWELEQMDELEFVIVVLKNKLMECNNQNTPLARKLRLAIGTIQDIRDGRRK